MTRRVTVAHGTRRASGNEVARALTAAAGERLAMSAVESYVELSQPLFEDVVASCVGPVTAAAFELWGVPTIHPERSRLGAMVRQLEVELPSRSRGLSIEVAGRTLLMHGDAVLVDGVEVRLSPAPFALLQALVVNPGHVVSRRELLAALPSGTAGTEHAVEMAVARLRAQLGTRLVQTVVKRGYRLAMGP